MLLLLPLRRSRIRRMLLPPGSRSIFILKIIILRILLLRRIFILILIIKILRRIRSREEGGTEVTQSEESKGLWRSSTQSLTAPKESPSDTAPRRGRDCSNGSERAEGFFKQN